jgi:hypothetical protein
MALLLAKGEVEIKDYFFATRWESRKIVECHLKVTNKRVLLIEQSSKQSDVQEVALKSIESVSGGFVRKRRMIFLILSVVFMMIGLAMLFGQYMQVAIGGFAVAGVSMISYVLMTKKSLSLFLTLNHQEHETVYVIGTENKAPISFGNEGEYRIKGEALVMIQEIGAVVLDARDLA